MRIRKGLILHRFLTGSDLRWLWEGAKTSFSIGKWWYRRTDEWRRWIARWILVRIFVGLPALGLSIAGVVLLLRYNVPPNDQFGAMTGEYIMVWLGAMLLFIVLETNRPLNHWMGQSVDLEPPVYRCITNSCFGNLLYHDVERAGQVCPSCRGKVRLLSAREKWRWY